MAAHGSGKEFDPDNPVVVTPLVRARTTNHEICKDLTRTSCFLSRRPRVPTLVPCSPPDDPLSFSSPPPVGR